MTDTAVKEQAAKERAAIASHSTGVVDSPWDGPGEVAAAGNDAAVLKHMHAWYAGDNPDQKGSYKFPHHAHGTSTPANINGVNNAKARLASANIPSADRSGVEAHLNRHQDDWASKQENAAGATDIRAARRDAGLPLSGRMIAFPAEFRYQVVEKNGKNFFQVYGYATVFNKSYTMYDMFGPFEETVDANALDKSLAASPDVAFLTNHRGVTMARTTNDTLMLEANNKGLKVDALLNAERMDVQLLMSAIKDELVTEMSFAFMLNDGTWNEEYDAFTITEADINRGDVSAVNYGANLYTSIQARAYTFMHELDAMPTSVQRAAYVQLSATLTGTRTALDAREAAYSNGQSEPAEVPTEESQPEPLSRSVALYRNRLMLEDQ